MRDYVCWHSLICALAMSTAGCATEPSSSPLFGATFELRSFSGASLPLRFDEQGGGTYYELLRDVLTFDRPDSVANMIWVRRVSVTQALDTVMVSSQRAAYSIELLPLDRMRLTLSHPCCPPYDLMCGGPVCPANDVGVAGPEKLVLFRAFDVRKPTLVYVRSTNLVTQTLPN